MTASMLAAARNTLALDIYPVPIKPGTKCPPMRNWPNLRLGVDDLPKHFSNGNGIGWLLGIKPRPIADVDVDCPEALAIAPLIAGPKTHRISGHTSNPASHYFYELQEEFRTEQFKDPLRRGTDLKQSIIELRGQPGQTVVPPSIHESGEQIRWEQEGEFGKPTFTELIRWVSRIAAAALLVRHWQRGHETRHALAGMLARAGWPQKDTAELVCAVVRVAQPDTNRQEVRSDVKRCYERLEQKDQMYGQTKLEELLGENGKKIVKTASEWLALDRPALPSGMILNEKGKIRPLLANAITVLRTDEVWNGVIALNEFSLYPVTRKETPWGKPAGKIWDDTDDIRTSEWLQHRRIFVSPQTTASALQAIAEENRFHPVKEYLSALKWDGNERIDRWLVTYLGAPETAFIKAIGSRWLVSAVARIFRPGCQADHTLLLEGPQGIRKSTALRTLAGPEWFTDHISDLDSKDSRLELHGVWIVELAELASIKRSRTEKVKSFLTATSDHFRPPYGRRTIHVQRSNVFAGSVNDATPFTDETGNRRFWPVRCGNIDVDGLARDRDQLWAEALQRYEGHSVWWLDTDALNKLANEEQEARYEPGVWDEVILKWLGSPQQRQGYDERSKNSFPIEPFNSKENEVTITDILVHGVGKDIEKCTQSDRNQVARCLAHARWNQTRKRVSGVQLRIYAKETP